MLEEFDRRMKNIDKLIILSIDLVYWTLLVNVMFTKGELYHTNYDFFTHSRNKVEQIIIATTKALLIAYYFTLFICFLCIDGGDKMEDLFGVALFGENNKLLSS